MSDQTDNHSLSLTEWLEKNPQITREELAEEVVRYRQTVHHLSAALNNECREHALTRSRLTELQIATGIR